MIIGNNDPKLNAFLSYMANNDSSRSADPYWYRNAQDKRYLAWFVIEVEKEIVACSAVQDFGNYGRILTRFCIRPDYRTKYSQQSKHNGMTYAFQLVIEQLEFCKNQNLHHAFFSTENKRIGVIKRHVSIAKSLGLECEYIPGIYNTCKVIDNKINDVEQCWQNICLYRLSQHNFQLPYKEKS